MNATNRYLRRRNVLEKVGFSSTLLFNLEKDGDFPQHFMLTPRCAVWSEAEIDDWIRQRAERAISSTSPPKSQKRQNAKRQAPPSSMIGGGDER